MNVLLVTRKFPPPNDLGAVATLLWEVSNGLVDRGVNVVVLAGPHRGADIEEPRKGLRIVRFKASRAGVNRSIPSALRKAEMGADVIHLHDVLPMGLPLLWRLSRNPAPRFWTWHNLAPLCRNSFLWPPCSLCRGDAIPGRSGLCYLDREPDCKNCFPKGIKGRIGHGRFLISSKVILTLAKRFNLIVPSRAAKRVLQGAVGEPVRVIPNATVPPPLVMSHREANPVEVVFGGRIVPEKGLDLLVDSLRGVDVQLTSYGLGRTEYCQRLAQRAREAGVNYIQKRWVAYEKLHALLSSADLCAVPSRGFETFGMIALDAESAGLPLVLSRSGGLTEVAADGKNALYFDREDCEGLALAIDSLARDPKRRAKYSRISRKIVQTRFPVSRHVDLLLKAYESKGDQP